MAFGVMFTSLPLPIGVAVMLTHGLLRLVNSGMQCKQSGTKYSVTLWNTTLLSRVLFSMWYDYLILDLHVSNQRISRRNNA